MLVAIYILQSSAMSRSFILECQIPGFWSIPLMMDDRINCSSGNIPIDPPTQPYHSKKSKIQLPYYTYKVSIRSALVHRALIWSGWLNCVTLNVDKLWRQKRRMHETNSYSRRRGKTRVAKKQYWQHYNHFNLTKFSYNHQSCKPFLHKFYLNADNGRCSAAHIGLTFW